MLPLNSTSKQQKNSAGEAKQCLHGTYCWASTTLHGTGTSSLGTEFGGSLLGNVGALLGFLKLLLGLAELGQVEGGDLLGLLDLPLLVNQILHALVVLAVLLRLEAQLLDAALRLAQVLLGVGMSSLFAVQLGLELAHALLQLLNGLLASLQGVRLGLIQADLQFLDLLLKSLAQLLLGLGMVLLGAQLIGQAGSVNHGLLGLLLGVLGFIQQLVQVGVQSLQLRLELPLGGGDRSVLGGHFVQLLVSIAELLFGLATATVGLLQQGARLLQFVLESVGTALRDAQLFAGIVAGALLLLQGALDVLQLLLVALDVLLGLSISLASVAIEKRESLGLALGFGLQRSLHRVQGALVVLARVLELFFLLLDAAVNFLTDLRQFKLSAQNLVLLLLQGSLSLLEGGLQLVLLGLQALARLLDFVDVAATLTDLVQQILDLIGQVLVLTADSLKLLLALLVGTLQTEQLGRVVAALLLRSVQLGGQIVDLQLPFADDLVEGLLLLLGSVGDRRGTVNLELQILDLGGQALLGLLQGNALLVQRLDGLLGLGKAGLQLALGLLELLGTGNALRLVLAAPQLSLSVGLAELALNVALALGLLLNLLAQVVQVVLQVAELAQQSGALASLLVGKTLGILQLLSERDLDLAQLRHLRLGILQLAQQIGVLDRQLLLGGIEVVQSALIDLFGHLGDGIVVLLAQVSQSALMLDVGLLQIAAQLSQLSLTLLVQLNLGRGGTASLLQTLAQLLKLAGQISALLLSLGASLTLGLDFLLELLNAGLQFLDLLLQLADQRLFVLQLGGQGGDLLVLAQDSLLQLLLVALQVGDSLLGQLEVSLNLALGLLNVTAQLLLALQRVLQLVEGLLQLGLHLVQVVDLVFGGLQLFSGLLVDLTLHLLLLVQLVDQLVLVGDLIVQVADLVILGGLVLLDLLDLQFQIFAILLLASDFLLQLLLGLEELVAGILFLGQALLSVLLSFFWAVSLADFSWYSWRAPFSPDSESSRAVFSASSLLFRASSSLRIFSSFSKASCAFWAFSSSFCNLESDVCSFTALLLRFGVVGATGLTVASPPATGIVALAAAIDVGFGCFTSCSVPAGAAEKLKLGMVKTGARNRQSTNIITPGDTIDADAAVAGNKTPPVQTVTQEQKIQRRRSDPARFSPKNTHGNLVLNAGNVQQRLHLLPQLPPGPGTQLQVLAQIALDDLQGDALLLHLLELLTRQVTAAPGLHPGHDLGETLITELLHLTQDTGTEEDLRFAIRVCAGVRNAIIRRGSAVWKLGRISRLEGDLHLRYFYAHFYDGTFDGKGESDER
uniref:Uncharacterized protein n=1 Tax=Anopheles atroparvus TaxID=41427 RepID=A0A182JJS0_ANOAO